MSPEERWLIPDPDEPLPTRTTWERIHEEGYTDVFSVSEDATVRRRIVELTLELRPNRVVLVGCGSRTHVQRDLLDRGKPALEVVAADFEGVIALACNDFNHSRLSYLPVAQLDERVGDFDCVVAVNVAVSGSDRTNRRMIGDWSRLLKDGGRLVSLMPIFSCGLEWAQLTGRRDIGCHLNLERSSWYEERQETSQVEYMPLRLRRVLLEAGLSLQHLEILFLADDNSRGELERVYGLTDPDLLVYEQLLVAVRGDPPKRAVTP